METPIGTRTKLVPNRGNEGPSTQAHQQDTLCQFMPTPGVDLRGLQEGPAATSTDVEGGNEKETVTTPDVRIEEVDISSMVEELQRLNDEEAVTSRSARANARRNYTKRSSRFVPPRSR
ncbi:Uncharacterized protein Fot_26093 [Forsythia ovata]|uniref:Uncharacterized protein n=1 Tax=Forsythia ovata TaxID=205694 RepID=A0ABD1UC70_9LAMI